MSPPNDMPMLDLTQQVDLPGNHLEFEVPNTAGSSAYNPASAHSRKHFSIDLSLELERQLDLESLPPTPNRSDTIMTARPSIEQVAADALDPHILASIVVNLRDSLSKMTQERDDLLALVSTAHEREAELKDALQHMSEKATSMEDELADARKKSHDDDEAISMLRSKVEESRRGLMQLQRESRRTSVQIQPMDLARAGISNFSPPSNKRASFTPLTGNRNTSPNAQNFPETPTHNRRISAVFARDMESHAAELEAMKSELSSMKETLQTTKSELAEAHEAREASETCVKALREFIEDNNVGASSSTGSDTGSLKLPPLPTATTGHEVGAQKSNAGWGFNKLWKVDTSVTVQPPSAPSSAISTAASPVIAPPLSRKFTGFFSRGSISSMASVTDTPTAPPMSKRDSSYSSSDVSSIAEPISPTGEVNQNVLVRDLSDTGSTGSSRSADLKAILLSPEPKETVVLVS